MAKRPTFSGPGGTVYTQVAKTARGRVGVADLGLGSYYRVRVEPASDEAAQKMTTKLKGWRQPGDDGRPQNRRFSKIVSKQQLEKTVSLGKSVVRSSSTLKAAVALEASVAA